MATILLDARNIIDEPAGVGRYALALIPELVKAAEGRHRFVVLRHVSNREPLGLEGVTEIFEPQRNDDFGWVMRGGARLREVCSEHSVDLYHSLFHVLPARMPDVPTVMTMHDFIWIDHPQLTGKTGVSGWMSRQFWARVLEESLARADEVIHVSATTMRRARGLLRRRWDARRHRVIHHGVAEHYFGEPPALPARWLSVWEAGPVVVGVGNAKDYKNLKTLVRAVDLMERDDAQLVLIGRCDGLEAHANLSTRGRIHRAGIADDETLHALVGHADAFVFPSLIEGFGMPPLEAMAMGRATLVSARQPMLEVCVPGAETFPALDHAELARSPARLLGDADALADAEESARRHARRFTWSRCAEETMEIYDETLDERGG